MGRQLTDVPETISNWPHLKGRVWREGQGDERATKRKVWPAIQSTPYIFQHGQMILQYGSTLKVNVVNKVPGRAVRYPTFLCSWGTHWSHQKNQKAMAAHAEAAPIAQIQPTTLLATSKPVLIRQTFRPHLRCGMVWTPSSELPMKKCMTFMLILYMVLLSLVHVSTYTCVHLW